MRRWNTFRYALMNSSRFGARTEADTLGWYNCRTRNGTLLIAIDSQTEERTLY